MENAKKYYSAPYMIAVRLNGKQQALLQQAADKAGVTRHQWMRETLLNRAKRAIRKATP